MTSTLSGFSLTPRSCTPQSSSCQHPHQAQVVKELEERLLEREELDDHNLSREFEVLVTRESSLDHREAALESKWKTLEDACVTVFFHELAIEIKETNLKTQVTELEEREKRRANRQMQELAIAQKRLADLQASCAGEAR
jgi:hypothetical protein